LKIDGLKARFNIGSGNARVLKVIRDEDFGGKIVAKQAIFMTKSLMRNVRRGDYWKANY
jgi:hypothetical protein